MLEHARLRMEKLQRLMQQRNIAYALFTDESSIAYLAGFWGYLGIEFGRPTMLLVAADNDPIVITPLMESEMVAQMTWIKDVRPWEDSGTNQWDKVLQDSLQHYHSTCNNSTYNTSQSPWIETRFIPAIVRNYLDSKYASNGSFNDISPILGELRMIKSDFEIDIMRQAGKIAAAMMQAAHQSLQVGEYEYESALAVINAGTRAAAGFLTDSGWQRFVSPMIHNLQIMQSGKETSMVHRRANVKRYQTGDPVYFCFCNMAQFQQYKLGFDRMFFIETATDKAAHVQQVAIEAQQAALKKIKSGITAEEVSAVANEVYQQYGFSASYRTGRSIGMAYLEAPELKAGDKTVLQSGMTFAVDGGISMDGITAGRIGDSIVVTDKGFEYLTEYPRELLFSQ